MYVYAVLATWPSGEADVLAICASAGLAQQYATRWIQMHPAGTTVIRRFTLIEA